MKLITVGDIIDFYIRIKQKGFSSILNKIGLSRVKRVENNWNENKNIGGFWNIPFIMENWNKVITGNSKINYPEYFCNKYLLNHQNYTLLSIGCGTGFYEREFAKQKCFSKIVGIELSENRVREAEKIALENNFNIKYLNQNFYNIDFKNEKFDVILFNESLHHFDNIEVFLSKYIKTLLNGNGFLVICEYVGKNRIYVPNFQLKEANKLLKNAPEKYRKYTDTSSYKKKIYSPGLIRMKLNDPSEAVDSEAILPTLHKYFHILEEKQLGMNLLMPLMRGIANNFTDNDNETKLILTKLLEADTNFTNKNCISDYIFGVYKIV